MQPLRLHHYGFLTSSTVAWLRENEQLFGPPHAVSATIGISSQQVSVTFVEPYPGAVLIELVEPWPGNTALEKMLVRGITMYHTGYLSAAFDRHILEWEAAGERLLQTFHSEAFGGKRCAFVVTHHLGLVELIEC